MLGIQYPTIYIMALFIISRPIIFSFFSSPHSGPFGVCHHRPRAASGGPSPREADQPEQHSSWKPCSPGGCHTARCQRYLGWGRCFWGLPEAVGPGYRPASSSTNTKLIYSFFSVYCECLYHRTNDSGHTHSDFCQLVHLPPLAVSPGLGLFLIPFSLGLEPLWVCWCFQSSVSWNRLTHFIASLGRLGWQSAFINICLNSPLTFKIQKDIQWKI